MAPLISQIYSYRQPVSIGAGACALCGFASVVFSCAGFAPSLSVSFATSSAITSLVFPSTGPLAFTRFEFRLNPVALPGRFSILTTSYRRLFSSAGVVRLSGHMVSFENCYSSSRVDLLISDCTFECV
jgi:hypothetical protein